LVGGVILKLIKASAKFGKGDTTNGNK